MPVVLACPVTRSPLRPAPELLVQKLLALAAQRALRTESARLVTADFTAAWLTADGHRAWLIRHGMADFSPGAAVLLQSGDLGL